MVRESRGATLTRDVEEALWQAVCGVGHTARSPEGRSQPGMEFAGGRVFNERGFRAVAPNIMPEPEIVADVRDGRRPDGSLIGSPMPIELYRGLSDRDVLAMVAYIRTVPAVHHAVTERSSYPDPLAPRGPPVAGVADPPADDPVARGDLNEALGSTRLLAGTDQSKTRPTGG